MFFKGGNMKIVCLGGRKNGHAVAVKSVDVIYVNSGTDTVCANGGFQTSISQASFFEEYFLKFITRGKTTKIFYALSTLDMDEINDLSNEYWEVASIVGYIFE
jgi:hypothetical protein